MSSTNSELLDGGRQLPLVEDFYTIQGEGFHAGKPAYFIRLGGCDVGCRWCDANGFSTGTKEKFYAFIEALASVTPTRFNDADDHYRHDWKGISLCWSFGQSEDPLNNLT